MFIKTHHIHLKQQFEAKCQELKIGLDNPQQCLGFLNLLRDVEHLYLQVGAYEDALNDVKNLLTELGNKDNL